MVLHWPSSARFRLRQRLANIIAEVFAGNEAHLRQQNSGFLLNALPIRQYAAPPPLGCGCAACILPRRARANA
jgi:hypothetical protein